ncbi:hypothetical protein BDN70DRAFT_872854 [Pholiota conissans]|uniref:Uncharacterized protein n=1 Tax=Pholiota conissans TaxID=109636 RepID=A0A9P5ZCG3_9AGAR|nr:hypothetical protein BDN70DRAFT_872854 [Pholiota conissans]
MSTAEEAIIANADHHSSLLKTIASLDYVPAAQKEQGRYIKDLEEQIQETRELIVKCKQKTAKERKEHEALRDSTARRLAHKLIGKKEQYEAKESKEEREYVEALEEEMREKRKYETSQSYLKEAQAVMADLNEKRTLYESAQAELQALYQRVFDGPTESFPEDDKLEYDLDIAFRNHEKILGQVNAESRAAELLARACLVMDSCQKSMQEALGYSRYDMWGGGTLTDMMERNALANAQTYASQVETLVDQAVYLSPAVKPVGRVNIARGSIVSDVFFDNIFTDLNFYNKIKQSAAQVLLANERLRAERDTARRRVEEVGSQLNRSADILDRCRSELDAFRRATFESYAAQHPPPPSYDVVTTAAAPQPPPPPAASPPPAFPAPSGPPPASSAIVDVAGVITMPMPSPLTPPVATWGSRNPYASALSEQTRKMSTDRL